MKIRKRSIVLFVVTTMTFAVIQSGWADDASSPDASSPDASSQDVSSQDVSSQIGILRDVGKKGKGNQAAIRAWRKLSRQDAAKLTQILAGLDGAGPLAANYLRAAVDAIAERTLQDGGKLPAADLEAFIADQKHAPRARRLAFDWLARVDKTAPDRLIPKMLDDPSLELRRDAVARVIDHAAGQQKAEKKDQAIAAYKKALSAARDVDQVTLCSEALKELGEEVDLQKHFGFIANWQLVGPFDNRNQAGYQVAYAPEKEINLTANYEGTIGKVNWQSHTTEEDFGIVDIAIALDKYKGAIVYATADFYSDRARQVEFRLGCINANKLWVNGKLLTANEVYHANMQVDQYVGRAKLKPGKNVILLKICQNEQTEQWAQRWQFQLRVCDQTGTAILSTK